MSLAKIWSSFSCSSNCRTGSSWLGPCFRTGMQAGSVDPTGKVLDTTVIYPTAPTNETKIRAAKETLKKLISKYHVTLISVGNGTASRESEQIIVELLKEIPEKVQYVITNEAGASVYSASKLATEEFPNSMLDREAPHPSQDVYRIRLQSL